MRRLLFAATVLVSASTLRAAEPCVTLDDKAVAALFDDWNFALSSLDASQVAQRYWPNAVLLPTASNTPGTSQAMIDDYFKQFLVKRPRGRIDTRTIQSGCNLAVDMGTYTFSLMDDKGTTSEESARYTFVYQYRDGAWKILHQHSSAMPQGLQAAAPAMPASSDNVVDEKPVKPKPRLAKAEPTEPLSRRERREMLREAARAAAASTRPAEAKPANAKPAPVATSVAAASVTGAPTAATATPAAVTPAAVTPTPASAGSAAMPAEGKIPPEVRTAMFANLTLSPAPAKFYPAEAARRKEHGSVNLKVCADGAGTVSDSMEIVKSSGSKLLDEAAMTWARAVTWVPATYNRRRVEGCAKVDVSFEPPPELAARR